MAVQEHDGGVVVATLGVEGKVRLWDGDTGDLLAHRPVPPDPAAVMVLHLGAQGLHSAVGNHDGLFDIGLTGPSTTFSLPIGSIVAMADVALPDGRRLVALALRDGVQLRDIDSGELLVEFDTADRAVLRLACRRIGSAVLVVAGCDFGVVQTWRWSPAVGHDDGWSGSTVSGWRGSVTLLATRVEDDGFDVLGGGPGGALLVAGIDADTGDLSPPEVLLDRPGGRVTAVGAATDAFVAAAEDVTGTAVVQRWRTDRSPDGHVHHSSPVRGLATSVRIDSREWAVGWAASEIVLVPLTGELRIFSVPIPVAPEMVRVNGDDIYVASAGGFLGLRVTSTAVRDRGQGD